MPHVHAVGASLTNPAAPLSLGLRGATPIGIRPVRADDLALERRFVEGLSRQTRYLRLMSGRDLMPGELERWTAIDPAREIALVAIATLDGHDEQLGVARCVRDDDDPAACDFAIVVADRAQHQGLGEALLRALMQAAADAGIARFAGLTLSENRGMLALARRVGLRLRRDAGDATVTRLEADLRGTAQHDLRPRDRDDALRRHDVPAVRDDGGAALRMLGSEGFPAGPQVEPRRGSAACQTQRRAIAAAVREGATQPGELGRTLGLSRVLVVSRPTGRIRQRQCTRPSRRSTTSRLGRSRRLPTSASIRSPCPTMRSERDWPGNAVARSPSSDARTTQERGWPGREGALPQARGSRARRETAATGA